MKVDSPGAIKMMKQKSRHIKVHFFWLKNLIKSSKIFDATTWMGHIEMVKQHSTEDVCLT
jgi:hypothetical protein